MLSNFKKKKKKKKKPFIELKKVYFYVKFRSSIVNKIKQKLKKCLDTLQYSILKY